MPPQPRSSMKPDPTMLLCYVPDLVFTLIQNNLINFNQNRFIKILFFRFFTSIYPQVFQKTKNLKACIAYADRYQNMKKANLHSTSCPDI